MPRVHSIKKARKEFTTTEDNVKIKKGDPYYYWKFRYGGYRTSSIYPKPRQLTQSAYLQSIYDIQDMISNIQADENIADEVQNIISEIENLRDEQQERLDNMPEHLQDSSSSGQMLTERIDALENALSELEGIDTDVEIDENDIDEAEDIRAEDKLTDTEKQQQIDEYIEERKQEKYQEILDEIQGISLE